jgi:hypothetical protein
LRGPNETSVRTSSDESASTRVEPTPNEQIRDVENRVSYGLFALQGDVLLNKAYFHVF